MKLIDLNDGTTINAEYIAVVTPVRAMGAGYYYNIVLAGVKAQSFTQAFEAEEKAHEHRSWLINILKAQ